MTDSFVTSGIVLANTLAIVTMATTEHNPFLECVQNGASVGASMGIFLWREMKRAERYEKLYDPKSSTIKSESTAKQPKLNAAPVPLFAKQTKSLLSEEEMDSSLT